MSPIDVPSSLLVRWADGYEATVNLSGTIAKLAVFAQIEEPGVFARARVIDWGTGVGWPGDGDAELSTDTLRRMAEIQNSDAFDARAFKAWQEDLDISISEAADLLGVDARTVKNYRSGHTIPRAVGIACRFLHHDRVAMMASLKPRKAGRPRSAG